VIPYGKLLMKIENSRGIRQRKWKGKYHA